MQSDDFRQANQDLEPLERANALKTQLNALVETAETDHLAWADLAEAWDQHALALREVQLAVRDQPDNPLALKRLGILLLERGKSERAAVHLEAALKQSPTDTELLETLASLYAERGQDSALEALQAESEARGLTLRLPSNSRTWELAPEDEPPEAEPQLLVRESSAIRFLQAFGGREDLHARQWASRDGRSGYSPVQQPLTPKRIQGHLAGNETLGVYCLRLDGTVNFMALDLDITKAALEAAQVSIVRARNLKASLQATTTQLHRLLNEMGFEPLIENSGHKGRHLWILFAQPLPAEVAHLFGSLFLRRLHHQQVVPPDFHVEFFPKQADRNSKKGLGNLIKLPLGIHQKSGRRSLFLSPEGEVVTQWDQHLAAAMRHSPEQLYAAVENLKSEALPEVPASEPTDTASQLPAPAAVQRQWTEADFSTDPQMQQVFGRCASLRQLKRQLETHRQLNQNEQVVLIHSLGHLEHGVMAVNYLLARAANVSPEKYLKSRLKGNPISCLKIRSRIPHITSRVACNCSFEQSTEQYPTPVLHLAGLTLSPASAPENLEQLARRYATLETRLQELHSEHQQLGQSLITALKQQAEACLPLPEGRYRLVNEADTEVLVWEPKHGT